MLKTLSIFASLTSALLLPINANAGDQMITLESPHDVSTTLDKLVAALESKGMNIFARIDHAEGAKKAGMDLRPTQVLLFGNPKIGTPLMLCSQSIAIDLPQKMLAWQTEDGKVYLGYTDPMELKARHETEGCDEVFKKVAGALGNFAKAATSP